MSAYPEWFEPGYNGCSCCACRLYEREYPARVKFLRWVRGRVSAKTFEFFQRVLRP